MRPGPRWPPPVHPSGMALDGADDDGWRSGPNSRSFSVLSAATLQPPYRLGVPMPSVKNLRYWHVSSRCRLVALTKMTPCHTMQPGIFCALALSAPTTVDRQSTSVAHGLIGWSGFSSCCGPKSALLKWISRSDAPPTSRQLEHAPIHVSHPHPPHHHQHGRPGARRHPREGRSRRLHGLVSACAPQAGLRGAMVVCR